MSYFLLCCFTEPSSPACICTGFFGSHKGSLHYLPAKSVSLFEVIVHLSAARSLGGQSCGVLVSEFVFFVIFGGGYRARPRAPSECYHRNGGWPVAVLACGRDACQWRGHGGERLQSWRLRAYLPAICETARRSDKLRCWDIVEARALEVGAVIQLREWLMSQKHLKLEAADLALALVAVVRSP